MSSFIPNPDPAISQYRKLRENSPSVMLSQLDALEDREDQAHAAQTRWIIPYADLLTLLFGLFIALFSLTKSDSSLWQNYAVKLEKTVQQTQSDKTRTEAALVDAISKRDNPTPQQQQQAALATTLRQKFAASPELSNALNIHPETQGLVISITDHILFAPGSADLSQAAKEKLDVVSNALLSVNRPIRIEGHTDDSPIQTSRYPSNWELSTARATHIIQYLVQSRRFPPEKLSAAGYGEFHPVANNSSNKGKQKNRRVDIVLLDPI
ncbi:MAG: OmpA family protein [Vampirovibrionales bacterium]|nr:OmpA family protein [Vampirovibrionales bacterium]